MKRRKRIGIQAIVVVICTISFSYIDYPYSVIVCLAMTFSLAIFRDMLRMCDRLLDPPPAIFHIFIDSPRIFPEMPSHDLTGFIEQSDHQPHSLTSVSNRRIRHNDKAT